MGIITNVSQWFTSTVERYKEKRAINYMNKIKEALDRMNKEQIYNPYKAGIPSSLYNENRFTINLAEAYVWYQGKEEALSDFYNQGAIGMTTVPADPSMFWKKSPTDGSVRRVHSGLPKNASDTFATILFGNGYKVETVAYNEDGTKIDEAKSEELQQLINYLSQEEGINIRKLLEQSAATESWAGDVAWKIAIDTSLSPYPILMASDPRNYEPIVIKGITVGIKFKDYKEYKTGDTTRKLVINEFYTQDSDKTSMIVYTVDEIRMSENGAIKPVRLVTVQDEYIQSLINQQSVVLSDDGLSATIRFNGLKGMLAWHKPNRVNNSYGYNAIYGESDHVGNFTIYDSLDEAVSVLIEEARTNKSLRMIPENMTQKDGEGNFQKMNEFITNFLVTTSRGDSIGKEDVKQVQFLDKTADHLKKYETFLALACANIKISPISLGLMNLAGLNNGDKTLQERTRVTAETRKKKHELWKPFLEKVFYKLVEVFKYMYDTYPEVRLNADYEALEADSKTMTINVSFADYNEMGILDKAALWTPILSQGGVSIDQYVEEVRGDTMTKEAKAIESAKIKIEKNVGINNPDLLTLEEINKLTPQEE